MVCLIMVWPTAILLHLLDALPREWLNSFDTNLLWHYVNYMHFLNTCFINICSHKTTILFIHVLFCKDILFSRYYKYTNFPVMTPNFESEHFNCCQNVYIYVYANVFQLVKIDHQTSSYIFLWIDIFLYW